MITKAACFLDDSLVVQVTLFLVTSTVLPAKSDSDVMFCLQSYQRIIIDSSLVY